MHDLVVVSDLHLGRGRNPETGRYHGLEAFFYDEDFHRFCAWLCRDAEQNGREFKLILNGDTFDFLRIEPEESEWEHPGERHRAAFSPAVAAAVLERILEGHPTFVDALALVLQAGREVIVLPGNHDAELQWEPVREELREVLLRRLRARTDGAAAQQAAARLVFRPWFHHEPGRVWIEHGGQYDPECAFRYPLRAGLARTPDVERALERDVPLGNFFQRYLFNAFGHVTFIVPSSRANTRYMRWMLLNRPRLLLHVGLRQAPFAWRFLRRLARTARRGTEALARNHVRELHALAADSGLGDALVAVDSLKQVHADLVATIRQMAGSALRAATLALLLTMTGTGLWLSGLMHITEMQVGFGVKEFLLLALNFAALAVLVAVAARMLVRSEPQEHWPLRDGARRVAALTGVPLVAFGHSHDEAIWRVDPPGGGRAWYYNTGTWIAVFGHDALLPRERVQYTFLRVRGTQGELLQWSPGRGEAQPVILLDGPAAGSEASPAPEIAPA